MQTIVSDSIQIRGNPRSFHEPMRNVSTFKIFLQISASNQPKTQLSHSSLPYLLSPTVPNIFPPSLYNCREFVIAMSFFSFFLFISFFLGNEGGGHIEGKCRCREKLYNGRPLNPSFPPKQRSKHQSKPNSPSSLQVFFFFFLPFLSDFLSRFVFPLFLFSLSFLVFLNDVNA